MLSFPMDVVRAVAEATRQRLGTRDQYGLDRPRDDKRRLEWGELGLRRRAWNISGTFDTWVPSPELSPWMSTLGRSPRGR
jgi:hypothetical protein